MSDSVPIHAFWDGQVFRPESDYWARRADKQFARGEVLRLADQPERSMRMHNFYFASVDTAFHNLPPLWAERFSSPDALRKYALVKAGYCTSESVVCPSHADALRVAAFVRGSDEFALVNVKKNVVTRYVPKSQSVKAMGSKDFKESKERVLDIIADMIGVAKSELADANKPSMLQYAGTP